jgi:hypothetical protein
MLTTSLNPYDMERSSGYSSAVKRFISKPLTDEILNEAIALFENTFVNDDNFIT